jgi:Tol biopolymer transport system component
VEDFETNGNKPDNCLGATCDEIYTIDATGGKPFQVTNNTMYESGPMYESDPTYSPDGKKIVYSGYRDGFGDDKIYTIDSTGGKPFQLTDDHPESVDWSDDSEPSWGSGR